MVITSGGVGPTCDDVTIRAVGAAFNRASENSEAMRATILDKMGEGNLSPEVRSLYVIERVLHIDIVIEQA